MKKEKKIKDVLKTIIDVDIRKEIDDELDGLITDKEYKMLRKAARSILDDILKMPRKQQVDEIMDMQTLAAAFKAVVDALKDEVHSITPDEVMEDIVATLTGKKSDSKKKKPYSVVNDPIRKKIMKGVKIAIAIKRHQEKKD